MSEEGKSPTVPPASPAPAQSSPPAQADIDEFQRIALRVGKIVSASEHPNATRLLVLSVDVGDGTPRQIVAGIKTSYQPAELVGKLVVVVANLKPAMLRGVESQGMLLAASDGSSIVLVAPERPIAVGSTVK